MRFAVADPPYLGCCGLYDHFHPDGRCWDDLDTHARLVERLVAEFPDGWALACHTPSLRRLLPLCPEDVRVGAWVKPFASFKPNVNPAYTWEPVIFRGGRKRDRFEDKVRDYCAVNVTLRAGFTGAKPQGWSAWVFAFLGMAPEDEMADLFPGSGAVTAAWAAWCRNQRERSTPQPLFAESVA